MFAFTATMRSHFQRKKLLRRPHPSISIPRRNLDLNLNLTRNPSGIRPSDFGLLSTFGLRVSALLLSLFLTSSGFAAEFISGADFSHLAYFQNCGVLYKETGQPQDALAILKSSGLTCVRLRLFTSNAAQATADPYDYTNNLNYTVPLAVRVKNAGLQFMLDFHYSDTWADPGHQTKPAAWASLIFTQLLSQMRAYNSNSIAAFQAAGAMPDYVAVGNEISSGLLWPDGAVGGTNDTPAQWLKLAQLLNSAIQGIRDAAGQSMPKLIIHIDRGGDWAGTQWFFDGLQNQQAVPFDIIGESYYPFWHGPLSNVLNCLTNAARRYNKPVLIAETDFPWANSTNIYGIPATPNGQVQYLATLAQVVKSVPGGQGAGICWWGSEYQSVTNASLAGFDKRSFFDSSGNSLPIVDAMGQLVAPIRLEAGLTNLNLTLSWPLSGAALALVTASNLPPLGTWSPVTSATWTTGRVFTATLPVSRVSSHFYRLQSN
jgi:arabinogalactan endo-1,4-beta-galactosidase